MNYNLVAFETAAGTSKSLPESTLPEVCFSGRSNVGKSSLINRLIGRKSLARVSEKPGKTVTVNFYKLPGLRLADLPGYGYAKVAFSEKERWSELMENYFSSGRNISLVFQLVDARHPATADDIDMIKYLDSVGMNTVIVFTKCDKLNKTEREQRRMAFLEQLSFVPHIKTVEFSAHTGEGVEELRALIEAVAENN